MWIVILIILSVVFDALGDAFYYLDIKIWSHTFQSLTVVLLFFSGYLSSLRHTGRNRWILPFAFYIALRFTFFDAIFNITIGQSLFYIGSTSWYDIFFSHAQTNIIAWFKLIGFILCINLAYRLIKND